MKIYEIFQNIEKHYYLLQLLGLRYPLPVYYYNSDKLKMEMEMELQQSPVYHAKDGIVNIIRSMNSVYREHFHLILMRNWIEEVSLKE